MRFPFLPGFVVLVLAGCDYDRGSGVPGPIAVPATIKLSASAADPLVSAGETRQLTAVVRDANGSVIPTPELSWRTSDPEVAIVSGRGGGGTVTAVDDGTARITASVGAVEGALIFDVRRRLVSIELSPADSVVTAGQSMQLTVVGRDPRGQEIHGLPGATFTTSDPLAVLVSPTGVISALFNPFHPVPPVVTATVVRDGAAVGATKRIHVGSPAPPVIHAGAFMLTEQVEPVPVPGLGIGVTFFTYAGDRVLYRVVWSLLSGPPVVAHIHGPDAQDQIAPILVEIPLGSQTATHGTVTGSFSAADVRGHGGSPPISLDSLMKVMKLPASTYVDVHTQAFPHGEIRGPMNGVQ